jgi:hypothetical protein
MVGWRQQWSQRRWRWRKRLSWWRWPLKGLQGSVGYGNAGGCGGVGSRSSVNDRLVTAMVSAAVALAEAFALVASAVEGTSAVCWLRRHWQLRRRWQRKWCKRLVGNGDGLSGGGVGRSVCIGDVGGGSGDSTCLFFVLLLHDICLVEIQRRR